MIAHPALLTSAEFILRNALLQRGYPTLLMQLRKYIDKHFWRKESYPLFETMQPRFRVSVNMMQQKTRTGLFYKSAVIYKHFSLKCKNVFNYRKKIGADAHFCSLGLSALFASNNNPEDGAVVIKRALEVNEADKKLFKPTSNDTKHIFNTRKILFTDVCSKRLRNCVRNNTLCLAIDDHFTVTNARMASRKIWRTSSTDISEASLSSLVLLDAVVADAVDFLGLL